MMNKTKLILLLFVLMVSISPFKSVFAQTAATIVKVDTLKPGDVFDYILIVKKASEGNLSLPDSASFGDDFEIRSFKQYRPDALTDSLVYQLQFFGVGDSQIPEISLDITNDAEKKIAEVKTDVIPLFYKKLVEDEKESQLKPLKPIFAFAANYWVYILAILILSIIAFVLYKKFKKLPSDSLSEPEYVPAVFIDPLRELDRMLDEIKQSPSLKSGDFKGFYTDTGDAIRLYIERVYGENALEMTTSELKYSLLKKRFDSQLQNLILLILSQADRVKFAKFTPTMESAFDDLERAFDLAKKFRENDKQLIANLRYEFDFKHGLIKPDKSEEAQNDLG
ncbi:hypothetical protein EP331_09005 [bacterium]|nr:MAG: hypothetical protein EP331_09005 [bacterium]